MQLKWHNDDDGRTAFIEAMGVRIKMHIEGKMFAASLGCEYTATLMIEDQHTKMEATIIRGDAENGSMAEKKLAAELSFLLGKLTEQLL